MIILFHEFSENDIHDDDDGAGGWKALRSSGMGIADFCSKWFLDVLIL